MTSAPTTAATAAPNDFADALIGSFERAGYARVEPAILQPAEPFLDLSGEDIRKRMYLTTDPQGRELCLRPDLTIPVSRDYLASPAAGKPRGFCYLGPVFRHRAEGGGEFLQAGLEAALDQGLQPQDIAGAGSRSAHHRRFARALGISRRARCARRLRPQGG